MLGLEGYGSGSDEEDDEVDVNIKTGRLTLVTDEAPASSTPAPPPPNAKPASLGVDFASALPPPEVTTGSLFASMPAPGSKTSTGANRVVNWRPPLKTHALGKDLGKDEDSEDEDDDGQSAKRAKRDQNKASPSLASMLPPPKHGGSGGLGGGVLGGGIRGVVDLGSDGLETGSGMDRNNDGAGPSHANEELDDVAAGPARHPSQMYATDAHGEYIEQDYAAYGEGYQQAYGASVHNNQIGNPSTQFDVDGALAELAKGGKAQIRETNMASLRGECGGHHRVAFDPAAVLGEEHREKLTREAGDKPSATNKNKNQIGSLLYEAKQAEMKILEGKLAGTSHKAMAKQKYGW